MRAAVIPVILSGGAGTRLWPLSRELRPKQFLPLVSERTMLQETYLRTRALGNLRPPIVVCNEEHRFLVAEQMRQIDVAPQTIVLEPVGRNTAPAVAIAAWVALSSPPAAAAEPSGQPDPASDPLLLVLPADHVINDPERFADAVEAAAEAARGGDLVTFGVVPTRAETGYGYLRVGAPAGEGRWRRLEQFVEKPDRAAAEDYVASGDYLWNSGMFVLSARRYLAELERHAPAMAAACRRAAETATVEREFTRLGDAFSSCPADSIDYAVMEKTDRAAVVPLDAGWSDVGSWPALHEILEKDASGNVLRGDVIAEGCRECYIASSTRLVAAVGVEGYVIVETNDAVLVMPHARAQDVKSVVEAVRGRQNDTDA